MATNSEAIKAVIASLIIFSSSVDVRHLEDYQCHALEQNPTQICSW
jgi:hypothetical protein